MGTVVLPFEAILHTPAAYRSQWGFTRDARCQAALFNELDSSSARARIPDQCDGRFHLKRDRPTTIQDRMAAAPEFRPAIFR